METVEFINKLMSEYGITKAAIKKCMGISYPTLSERMLDGDFRQSQINKLMDKYGSLNVEVND